MKKIIKKFMIFILFLIIVISLVSCEQVNTTPPKMEEISKQQVGYTWIYIIRDNETGQEYIKTVEPGPFGGSVSITPRK